MASMVQSSASQHAAAYDGLNTSWDIELFAGFILRKFPNRSIRKVFCPTAKNPSKSITKEHIHFSKRVCVPRVPWEASHNLMYTMLYESRQHEQPSQALLGKSSPPNPIQEGLSLSQCSKSILATPDIKTPDVNTGKGLNLHLFKCCEQEEMFSSSNIK